MTERFFTLKSGNRVYRILVKGQEYTFLELPSDQLSPQEADLIDLELWRLFYENTYEHDEID